jgi:hypothetical protein
MNTGSRTGGAVPLRGAVPGFYAPLQVVEGKSEWRYDGLFACRCPRFRLRGRSLFRDHSRAPEHEIAFWDVV